MDEGRPIAYLVLDEDVPVYAAGGERVGTVDHVVAAPEQDIFHGIVMRSGSRRLFVPAATVAALHERGVDLTIDARQVAELPEPRGEASAGEGPSPWRRLVDRVGGWGGGG